MATILSLQMNSSREAALAAFLPTGPSGYLRLLMRGPLRSTADVYIPFRLYRIRLSDGRRSEERLLAVDAVSGGLDPYAFPGEPRDEDLVRVETGNCLPAALDPAGADAVIRDKVRRIVFGAGPFKIRPTTIQSEFVPLEFHIPYWIGFYGRGDRANFLVLDAVRGCLEGGKVRSLISDWLSRG